ncbi:MAG TPA: helix-turn-helix domain-containing protein [Solirubrobacterales bacterium]
MSTANRLEGPERIAMNVEDKQKEKKTTAEESPSFVFALNHRLRRQILRIALALPEGAAISPVETAQIVDRKLSNVSYHFRVLAEKEALVMVDTGNVRGSVEHFYRPSAALIDSTWVVNALRETQAAD